MFSLMYLLLFLTQPVAIDNTKLVNDEVVFTLKPELPTNQEIDNLLEIMRTNPTDNVRLRLASLYIQGSKLPGYGDWFHYADSLLMQYVPSGTASIDYLLLLSDIKQQQHHFSESLYLLDQVFQAQPQHIQASLIAARIHLAMHNTDLAQKSCQRLLSKDIFLFSVCTYEVLGRKGEWQTAYEALYALHAKHYELEPALDIWIKGILSEQAEQLGHISTAIELLKPVLDNAPTSLWLKWADLNLSISNADIVYETLSNLKVVESLEDSLLLRLAIAERDLKRGEHYQTIIHDRMRLRVIRQDTDHAADLAHYFLRLKYDPKLALYWANINYQSAKEPDDKKLLVLSEQALLAMKSE